MKFMMEPIRVEYTLKKRKGNSISYVMLDTHDHSEKIVVLQGDLSRQKSKNTNYNILKNLTKYLDLKTHGKFSTQSV